MFWLLKSYIKPSIHAIFICHFGFNDQMPGCPVAATSSPIGGHTDTVRGGHGEEVHGPGASEKSPSFWLQKQGENM